MDLTKLSKQELLLKCEGLGITKCKTKNKSELIELIHTNTPTKPIDTNSDLININYIDLCCGIGGFRIGIQYFQAQNKNYRFNCVLSSDIKDDAIKTYNINFNENNSKLSIYDIDNIPKFDLLCAGFPCQPFSSAGHKKGFEDERGSIIFNIINICKMHKPTYVLLENVSNLITLENGKPLQRICKEFNDLGYNVSYKKLCATDFGVPQKRERVFIVCCLTKVVDLENIKTKEKCYLGSIIDTNAKYTDIDTDFADKILNLHRQTPLYGYKMQDKRGGNNNIHSWDIGTNGVISAEEKNLIDKIMTERRKKHWAEKKKIDWMDGMPLTYNEICSFYKHEKISDMLNNLVQKKYLRLEKPKKLVSGKRVYDDEGELGYNICKGKLSFPITNILNPESFSPTLTATDSSKLSFIIEDKYLRKLNDTELKKICGFPDTYIIPSDVDKYDLFGNMVIPNVVEAILNCVFG
jgi:DNA (cytosine-5)-methyltransferase 1